MDKLNIQYDHRYFVSLLANIGSSDQVKVEWTADLILYCSFCRVTSEELNYLFQFVKQYRHKLPSNHPNVLFLQGLVNMYQEGLASPKTLRLLEQARQAGQPSATTLLGIAYRNSGCPQWLPPPIHPLARLKLWWRNRKGVRPLISPSVNISKDLNSHLEDLKKAKLLFKEADQLDDTASMVHHATWMLGSPDVDIKHPAYQRGFELLEKASRNQPLIAQYAKAYCLLKRDDEQKIKPLGDISSISEIEKEQALGFIDKAVKQGVIYAVTSKYFFSDKGYFSLKNKVGAEEARGWQRIMRLKQTPNLKLNPKALEEFRRKNQGQDPRIDYYVITSLNHKRPFIFWRRKIVALCEGRNAKQCRELLECIDQDIYLTDKQRHYFKTEILKWLSAAPNFAALLQDSGLGEFYLDYIDERIANASNDRDWQTIEKLYRKVPLSSPISACVNARLADAYYQAALDAGCTPQEAFEAAKPYHQLVFKAVKSFKKTDKDTFAKEIEKGGFSISMHQRMYQERHYKAASPAEQKNIKTALNFANNFYYKELSKHAEAPVENRQAQYKAPSISFGSVDTATQVLKEGLTPVSVLSSSCAPSHEGSTSSRFFLLALLDTVYRFFQARFTSSPVKTGESKSPQTNWQFFTEKTSEATPVDPVPTFSPSSKTP